MLKELGVMRGVNLGGWLSQCDYSEERLDTFITEDDFKQIAALGGDISSFVPAEILPVINTRLQGQRKPSEIDPDTRQLLMQQVQQFAQTIRKDETT